jgi:hypothetical protein
MSGVELINKLLKLDPKLAAKSLKKPNAISQAFY